VADSTSLNQHADLFAAAVGWYRSDAATDTMITLNGPLLAHSDESFPLRAQLKLFDGGELLTTVYAEEITRLGTFFLKARAILPDRAVANGYYELTVFPAAQKLTQDTYFGETWCSVWNASGSLQVSFPPLMMKGAELKVAASDLYYPGVIWDGRYSHALVLLNHYSKACPCTITVTDADGRRTLRAQTELPAKSAKRLTLPELFPDADLAQFFSGRPGLLVASFPYKINGYVQSVCAAGGEETICGMDHLGLLYNSYANIEKPDAALIAQNNANRAIDRVVCTCKSIPMSQLTVWAAAGCSVAHVSEKCGAGTVCRGCLPELEVILGERQVKSL
jgi:hypothetical protein